MKESTKNAFRKAVNRYAGFGRRTGKTVVFSSFGGTQYSDNPRAISEKMHELYPEYRLIWALDEKARSNALIPDYIEAYPVDSFAFRRSRASACCFVQNDNMHPSLYKRKKQLYIQTWHGDRGMKKILYDAWEDQGVTGKCLVENELTDLFVVGSDYAEKRIKSAFRYFGDTVKVGMPRNDKLVFPTGAEKIRQTLGLDPDVKILLYAPTLRSNMKVVKGLVNLPETLSHLEADGSRWICLLRAHPRSLGVDTERSEKILDVSRYPDMADLLMIADMLITDYSSSAGDFLLRRKAVILAQFDVEEYNRKNRTFYVEPTEAGFLIAHDQEELNRMVDTMDAQAFAENCDRVLEFFGTRETGRSAEEICRIIDREYHERFGGR